VAVVASALLLAPATMNYLEFYVALSRIYLRVDSMSISGVNVSSDLVDYVVSGHLFLVHNSSYVGLKVFSVDIVVYYDYSVLFERRFWLGDSLIEPFSSLDLPMGNETFVSGYEQFADYVNQTVASGGHVVLLFSPCVNLYLLGNSIAERVYLEDANYTFA